MTVGHALLEVSGLSKSFGGVKAVDGIDFTLAAGELLALIGPNGAGKSTTFNMVNGQLAADTGSIRLGGQEMTGRKPREIWRMGVGRTFQIAATFSSLTVVENVQMALVSADGRLYSMWRRAADYRRSDALDLLDLVGMAGQADRPCSVLAYGDVKRVELAIAMANRPKLLLMDEPTAGMATEQVPPLMQTIQRIQRSTRKTIMLVEHNMNVVMNISDRITVMHQGEVLAEGTPREISQNETVQKAYLGELYGDFASMMGGDVL